MSDSEVIKALQDRFMAWTGDTDLANKAILENDTPVDPDNTTLDLFYRVNTIFARHPTLVGSFVESGQYRIEGEFRMIVAVRKGSGALIGGEKADLLKAHFPRGLVLTEGTTKVKIEKVYRQTGVPSGSFFHIPVCAEFWVYQNYQP